MKITEAMIRLKAIKSKHGDIGLHLEVGEDVPCCECGEERYVMFCGTCKSISTINVSSEINAWLIADRG